MLPMIGVALDSALDGVFNGAFDAALDDGADILNDVVMFSVVLIAGVKIWILDGFADPRVGPERWEALLRATGTDSVYQTWQWQRAWWEAFGQGELLLIAAERDGRVVALAPFYSRWQMVFFIGSEHESDSLDFIGDVSDPEVLVALLRAASERVAGFRGFDLRLVPDGSGTGKRLAEAAGRLGLSCYDEWEDGAAAPVLDLAGRPDLARAAMERRSALKHERWFRGNGAFDVRHFRDGDAIDAQLEEFFEQHISRRAATPFPSLFLDPAQRAFYRRLTEFLAPSGWLRFARIDWQGRPIAFHFGFSYRGRYFLDRPSFATDVAHRSPGHLLLRHVLLAAIDEGAHTFDFGLGDEPYKFEYATHSNYVRNWGVYPS